MIINLSKFTIMSVVVIYILALIALAVGYAFNVVVTPWAMRYIYKKKDPESASSGHLRRLRVILIILSIFIGVLLFIGRYYLDLGG